MERLLEERVDGRLLGDAGGVHDDDVVGRLGDDAEVVRDEDDGRSVLGLELPDEPEDLRLRRHVERGRRLVRDEERRIVDERHRDHHALAHPARELVRVVVDAPFRAGDAHLLEPFDREPACRAGGDVAVQQDRLDELVADGQHRVQRRHRVLEDHRDLAPAERAEPPLRGGEQVPAGD